MSTELSGYRRYKKATAVATTHTHNFDQVGESHKVYVETAGVKCDRNNADCEVYLMTGGQQILLRHFANLTSGDGVTEQVGAWLYPAEFIRCYWQDIQSGDTLEMSLIGTDKWLKESD